MAQDSRFKSADKKLLAKMKFAPELDQKVDLNKVEIGAFIYHILYPAFSTHAITLMLMMMRMRTMMIMMLVAETAC